MLDDDYISASLAASGVKCCHKQVVM